MFSSIKIELPIRYSSTLKPDAFSPIADYYESGRQQFVLSAHKEMWNQNYRKTFLMVHEQQHKITITSNVRFLVNGYSDVPFGFTEFKKGIELLSGYTGMNLTNAIVKEFEFDVVIPSSAPATEIIHHHKSIVNTKSVEYPHGKYFREQYREIKIFSEKKSISASQKDNQPIHFSILYTNPVKYFNSIGNDKLSELKLYKLFQRKFFLVCKKDLLDCYCMIVKTGNKKTLPVNKKELCAGALLAYTIKEISELYPSVDGEKMVFQCLDSIKGLSSVNKSDRRRTLRKWFGAISKGIISPYDLTDSMIEILDEEAMGHRKMQNSL